MKTVCMGYKDANGNLVKCGKIIKDGPEADDEVSHGLCEECFVNPNNSLNSWDKLALLRFRPILGGA